MKTNTSKLFLGAFVRLKKKKNIIYASILRFIEWTTIVDSLYGFVDIICLIFTCVFVFLPTTYWALAALGIEFNWMCSLSCMCWFSYVRNIKPLFGHWIYTLIVSFVRIGFRFRLSHIRWWCYTNISSTRGWLAIKRFINSFGLYFCIFQVFLNCGIQCIQCAK